MIAVTARRGKQLLIKEKCSKVKRSFFSAFLAGSCRKVEGARRFLSFSYSDSE